MVERIILKNSLNYTIIAIPVHFLDVATKREVIKNFKVGRYVDVVEWDENLRIQAKELINTHANELKLTAEILDDAQMLTKLFDTDGYCVNEVIAVLCKYKEGKECPTQRPNFLSV